MPEYKTDTEAALEKAREEYLGLLRDKEELEIRIAKVARRVAAWQVLVDDSEETDRILELGQHGLTEAIKTVIKAASPGALHPREIVDRLKQLTFPVSEYRNFRASLSSVLKRLVAGRKVEAIPEPQRRSGEKKRKGVTYRWIQRFPRLKPG